MTAGTGAVTVARRLRTLEAGALAQAITTFRAAWEAFLAAGDDGAFWTVVEHAGFFGRDAAALAAWDAQQPPEVRAMHETVERAIGTLLDPAASAVAVHAVLTALAPHLELPADTPPHVVVRALSADLAA